MINASDLIEECQLLLGDPHGDYHDQDRMLIYLNRALRSLSVRSQSIESSIVLDVVEDQYEYVLPANFLRAKIVGFNSGGQGWYRLTPREDYVVTGLARSNLGGGSQYPIHYSVHGRAAIERLESSVFSADLSGHFFSSPSVDDSVGSANVFVGDNITNVTRGGECVVESIDGTTIYHSPLIGGEGPRFIEGDVFRVSSPQSPNHVLNIAPIPNYSSTDTPLNIYYSRYHSVVTSALISANNDVLEIDSELEACLVQYVCYWGAVAEHEAASAQAQTFMGNYNSEYFTMIPKVRKRMRDNLNAGTRWVMRRPRKANLIGAPDIGGHPFTEGVIV